MNDYEQRIKVLEDKVKILEETLETLKNMQMSEQMESYIKAKTRTLKMAELINSVSDGSELDLSREQNAVREIKAQKKSIDDQVESALRKSDDYSEKCATDIKYFEYEIENGKSFRENDIEELSSFIGKGIRITAYIGFDCESVIIPKEIDGLPVISIGTSAFKNATFSKIILPESLKIIMACAFSGCMNLKEIDLPNGLTYLGIASFSKSGLTHITFPESLKKITMCCTYCINLKTVFLGNKTKIIDSNAFWGTNVKKVVIPESVESIAENAFNSELECAFLGEKTTIRHTKDGGSYKIIYCLPGSTIQKYAREHNIPIKPLSEFKMEE